MKSYRDYLDEKNVPKGPWVTYENCEQKPKPEVTKPIVKPA